MTNSLDPDQIAPIGSRSTLFASILKFFSNVSKSFAADDFSRGHFSDAFFLGALRVIKHYQLLFCFPEKIQKEVMLSCRDTSSCCCCCCHYSCYCCEGMSN